MFFHADDATICALSTGSGLGAIGVIRVSGPDAIRVVNGFFSKELLDAKSHTAHYGSIRYEGRILDEVVVVVFRGPNSFTGEDVVEINCHGSRFVIAELLRLLVTEGCRMAQQGEFTFRAFMNGKMDLSQAEAVADLIASESAAEHQLAMHQLRGGFSREIEGLRERLIHFASLIELELDFAEEDVEFADRSKLTDLLFEIESMLKRLIDSFRAGNAIKNGIPVAIIGKPNAGKSTLLNALLNEERAIVSDIPGTTRDTIEDEIVIEGVRFRFIDTAGIRETEDSIERIGVERSMKALREATLVVYMYDARTTPADLLQEMQTVESQVDLSRQQALFVANKCDLATSPLEHHGRRVLEMSALTRDGLQRLQDTLFALSEVSQFSTDASLVTNIRHHQALSAAYTALQDVLSGLEQGISGDFLAIDIRKSLHHLGEITGAITTDDLLGNIFGKFCIGK
ncbi:MAG: hypothetical protein RL226_1813 [Bacteroidota bacterium]|jgi:tRNA modification GTPase